MTKKAAVATQDPTVGLLTVDEAAVRLGVTSKTVWRFLSQGSLKRIQHWNRTVVAKAEVDALKQERSKARS